MKIDMNEYRNTRAAGGIDRPVAGAYEFVITRVEDTVSKAGNPMLKCEIDIAAGEFKDFAAETAERAGFWPLTLFLAYGGKALGIFKRNMMAIESANSGFTFSGNETQLVKKHFYATLTEQHYTNQNGYDTWKNNIKDLITADDYATGRFKIPEPDYSESNQKPAAADKPNHDPLDDLPFNFD